MNNCIFRLLKYINLLQNNSNKCNYNTRVISIYNRDGTIFSINNNYYFRINKINNNTVNLLILENNNKYISTKQYITIPIKCIKAVRCIEDISLINM